MKLKEPFDIKKTAKIVFSDKPPKNAYFKIDKETYRVYYRRGNTAYVELIHIEDESRSNSKGNHRSNTTNT